MTCTAIDRRADVMEIVMAALKGGMFNDVGEHILRLGVPLPLLFNQLCFLFRTIQAFDAHFVTGWTKWKEEPATRNLLHNNHPFVQAWRVYVQQAALLKALLH